MQCPNCRNVEKGQWLFATGSTRPFPEFSMEDWIPEEDLYGLTYPEMVIPQCFVLWYAFFSCTWQLCFYHTTHWTYQLCEIVYQKFHGGCSNIGSIGARLVNSLKQVLSSKHTPLPWFLLLSLLANARDCFSIKLESLNWLLLCVSGNWNLQPLHVSQMLIDRLFSIWSFSFCLATRW